MLQKGIYPYEYIGDWEKFSETSLPEQEHVYSLLNVEDITDTDYIHEKRVYKDFETKSFGEYHDMYIQSNTLLLADVFENFWNLCLQMFSFWIRMASSFKKDKRKLDLLNDIDILLMIEKAIRRGMCHSIYWYAKAINKHT